MQHLTVLNQKMVLLISSLNLLFQLMLINSSPHYASLPGSITSLQVPGAAVGCPQSLLFSRLKQSWSHNLSSKDKCWRPDHPAGPLLNLLQFINIFPVLGESNTVPTLSEPTCSDEKPAFPDTSLEDLKSYFKKN